MAALEFFERPGIRGDERCIEDGLDPSYWVRIDGKYVAKLPQTTALRAEGYIRQSLADPLPAGQGVRFVAVEPWLPNCGSITLPDGREFQVRNHEVREVA